jgi:hypothetical protein
MVRLHTSTFAVAMILAASALAQQQPGLPMPRIDTVFPPGAKQGASIEEWAVTGTDIEEIESFVFSHPGIKAEKLPPPPEKEEPKSKDPKQPAKQPPPKKKNAPIVAKFKVLVAADVPPGNYDVRLVNKWGISNPRVFVVGDLPEINEKEPNNDVPEAMKIDLNTTINGTINSATDVDLYKLTGKKGQRVVLACMANSIDSKASPLVEVYETSGKRLASRNGDDPVIDVTFPTEGEYFVRVAEFTYTAGSPQHFYRLTVTTNPWIDAVIPPTIEAGKTTQVTLYGRNLPGGSPEPNALIDGKPLEKVTVAINAPNEPTKLQFRGFISPRQAARDGFEYRLKGPGGVSNAVLIGLSRDPVVVEKEPNENAEQAMLLTTPCEVGGTVGRRNDRDWFVFTAKKGEVFLIDLWADRLGQACDFTFTIRNGKDSSEITERDDNNELLSTNQFYNRTTDPEAYRFVAPEDGKYLVEVTSREAGFMFGPQVAYQLRVVKQRPDFRLIAMPADINAPDSTVVASGGEQYLKVFVYRQDGFNGPISLTAEGLPAGVTAVPQMIGTGQRSGTLVLAVAPNAAPFTGSFSVKGTATLNGQPTVREARSATIVWPTQRGNNTPTLTRLDQSLVLAIRDKAHFKVVAEPQKAFIKKENPITLPLVLRPGDKLTVPYQVTRISPDAKVPVTLQQILSMAQVQQMPVTVNNGQILPPVAADKGDGTFVIDVRSNAAPGTYVVNMRGLIQIQFEKEAGKGKKPTSIEQALAPITVTVIPTTLAKVTAAQTGKFVAGSTGIVTVKVDRQAGYDGEFQVKLVVPMGTKGVSAPEVKIPAGQSEAKVTVQLAPDAPAGGLNNILAQATGSYEGHAISQEVKFGLTIEKAPAPKKEEPKPAPKKEEPKKEQPKKEAPKKEEPKKK